MSRSSLRNQSENPYLFLEGATGSTAFGVDTTNSDQVNLVTSNAVNNLDPTSGTPSISVQSTTPGNITLAPKGVGGTIINNGSLDIQANSGSAGNLLMTNTTAAGLSGVIELGGNRFVHNYGTDNTFIGQTAGNFSLTVGSAVDNTAIGFDSLLNITTGSQNVSIGSNALNASTTGSDNVAIGYDALNSTITDNQAVAIGANSLKALNGGATNLAIGYNSIKASVTDNQNTGIGHRVLEATNGGISGGGSNNTAIGAFSLLASVLGGNNTAVGANTLETLNDVVTKSRFNTAIGMTAGEQLPSGSQNTFIGAKSGVNLAAGTANSNVLIGYNSGSNYTTTESSNILISNVGTAAESNLIRIGTQGSGDQQQNTCFIAGIYNTTLSAPAGTVLVDANGQLGYSAAFEDKWNDVASTPVTMAVNNGYVVDNGAALVTLNLPAVAAFGSRFEIVGKSSGGWTIAQGVGQQIHFGHLDTTSGGGGSLSSTLQYDCVELICVTANTSFVVKSSIGNLTVV